MVPLAEHHRLFPFRVHRSKVSLSCSSYSQQQGGTTESGLVSTRGWWLWLPSSGGSSARLVAAFGQKRRESKPGEGNGRRADASAAQRTRRDSSLRGRARMAHAAAVPCRCCGLSDTSAGWVSEASMASHDPCKLLACKPTSRELRGSTKSCGCPQEAPQHRRGRPA